MGFMDKFKEFSDKVNEQKAKQDAAAKAGTLHPGAKTFTTTQKAAAPVAPAPKSAPLGAAAAANNVIVHGQVTRIKYGVWNPVPYHDASAGIGVYLRFNGNAELTMIEPGAKYSVELAQAVIIDSITGKLFELQEQQVRVDQLPAHRNELMFAASSALRAKGIEAKVMLNSLTPDEASHKKLEEIKRRQALNSMTPDQQAEYLRKSQEKAMAEMRAQQSAGAAGAVGAAGAAAGQAPVPAFCPACGAPTGGAKFCSSCGTALVKGL